MDTDIRENTYGFEAVKTALRQTKDGISITLVIHPNDVPQELISDHIGSRYMCGMARLDDDNQVVELDSVRKGKIMVNQAGMLCRDHDFQAWLVELGECLEPDEAEAAETIRFLCGIESRSELKHNEKAQEAWKKLLADFEARNNG